MTRSERTDCVAQSPAKLHYGPSPVAAASRLLPEVAKYVPLTGDALSLDVINKAPAVDDFNAPIWNPFLNCNMREADPAKVQIQQLLKHHVGAFGHPGEMFQAKTLVPVKQIFAGLVAQRSEAEKAFLAPAAAALPDTGLLRTPAHQFNVDGRADNRILFFSDDAQHQENLRQLIAELGNQHKRVVVQWMHMSDAVLGSSPQGGTLQDVLGGKLKFGSSHVMGYSTGRRSVDAKTGEPWKIDLDTCQLVDPDSPQRDVQTTLVTTNWGDTSRLDDASKNYAVHLFAVDYQAGAHDRIPEETLAAYKRNADIWDCVASLLVKFSSDGDTFGYSTYEWNPLEVYDRASARDIAVKLASDWDTFSEKHGSFYCAEAQYSIANLGPQQDTLIKESLFGATRLGKLIKTFGEAPGYKGKPIEWCRQNPEIGWLHLFKCGKDAGGINYEEYFYKLGSNGRAHNPGYGFVRETYSNRQTVFLEFIPEAIEGWQAYRPRNDKDLIATPMTTAMVTWALMHQYLPTEGVTITLLDAIHRTYETGDAAVKSGITALAGGADPQSKAGQIALAVLASQLAGGFVLASLEDKSGLANLTETDKQGLSDADLAKMSSFAQLMMFKGSGYGEITTEADKSKVHAIWDMFIAALKNPANWTRDQLTAALHSVDAQAARLEVVRRSPGGATMTGLMQFVPPGAWAFWAQHPEYCQSYSLQYVATGLHKSLAKS